MSGDIEAESPFFAEGGSVCCNTRFCAMLVNAQPMRYSSGDLRIAVVKPTSPLRSPGETPP